MPYKYRAPKSMLTTSMPAEFEGDEYYKRDVKPLLENGDEPETNIYLWQESARHAS